MELLHIVVADGDIKVHQRTAKILNKHQVKFPFFNGSFECKTLASHSASDLLIKVEQIKPQIAIIDDKLPCNNVAELIKEINKVHPECQVVEFLSQATVDKALQATNEGATDFLLKPFTPYELRNVVENTIKQYLVKRLALKVNQEGRETRFQFLSVLSHELKAPLNAIEGYLEIIKDRSLGNQLEDYDQIIDRSVKRINGMRELIFDLLDITRIETGKKARNIQELSVVELAKLSIDTNTPAAIQKGVNIELRKNEPDVRMEADPTEIEIIFNNLISNAVKYNITGGRVIVTLTNANHQVIISVADTGIGLTADEQNRIFNDFVRIKTQKTKKISGTGLGLSIVKKMAEVYNGFVDVQSTPEKGTTFSVTLPKQLN